MVKTESSEVLDPSTDAEVQTRGCASTEPRHDERSAAGRWKRPRELRRVGLWAHNGFLKLWGAETISQFGSQITLLALPLAAVLELDANPAQMGLLGAAGTLPFLIFGLLAGVWIDRLRRKPLMIAADLGRAALLLAIPLAWVGDVLTIQLLYAVAFLVGSLDVIFEVSYVSFLPALVSRDQLIEANSKLGGSESVAQVAGPGLAGTLVGAITAPFAILIDAVSFLCSALLIGRIQVDETLEPRAAAHRGSLRRDIGAGLRVVLNDAILRAMTGASATTTFFGYLFLAVYVLYLANDLGLGASAIGLVFASGGVGAVIGALLAAPAARRLGIGPAIVWARLIFGLGGLPMLLAVAVPHYALPMVVASEFSQWLMLSISNVNQLSVRQAMVPNRFLGRVTATIRFATTGAQPIGAILGGLLGELLGIRGALLIGVAGMLIPFSWVLWSPVRTLREAPPPLEIESGATGPV